MARNGYANLWEAICAMAEKMEAEERSREAALEVARGIPAVPKHSQDLVTAIV